MIGLNVLFWIFVLLFAVIGMTRGWAKELLVTFSLILALFIIIVLERYAPFVNSLEAGSTTLFWVRVLFIAVLVFFGYQGPSIAKVAASGRFARERLQDSLLGFFLGGINGYLIWGTLWYYLDVAAYPFPGVFIVPPAGSELAIAIERMIAVMPPHWLGSPAIFFAVAIAFAFVLVVFL